MKKKDNRIRNCEAYDEQEFEDELVDKVVERLDPIDFELYDTTGEYLDNIKLMATVVLIYEITRNVPAEQKIRIHSYFRKVVDTKEPPFTREKKDSFSRLDPMRVSNLTYFKCNEEGRNKLMEWYAMNEEFENETGEKRKFYEGAFPQMYKNFLDQVGNSGR